MTETTDSQNTADTQNPADKIAPLADKARAFAKSKPYATAALAGVIGIALLNTLRGKGRKA